MKVHRVPLEMLISYTPWLPIVYHLSLLTLQEITVNLGYNEPAIFVRYNSTSL